MNDKERNARLHDNLTTLLSTDEQARFYRSGLDQEESLVLTFFHLFYDQSDPTIWIDRYRTCLNAPTPRQTIGSNSDLWIKLFSACAKIGVDWPGKESFLVKTGERFQREFDDAMRKRYSRENEEIAKLQGKLEKSQERSDKLEEDLRNARESHVDGETLFERRVSMYSDQFASCDRQCKEYATDHEAIRVRMARLGSEIHAAKQETPQFRQALEDARMEYNTAFDSLSSDADDTANLNDAHMVVMAAVKALHDHQQMIEGLEAEYIQEGNNLKSVAAKLEALPQQKDYLCKAVETLTVARKLFGFEGDVDLEALFPKEEMPIPEIDDGILNVELRGILHGVDLLQLIGPRNIKAARDVAKAFDCESTEDFVAAIVCSDLENRAQEALAKRQRGVDSKSLKTFLNITLPNLKKRWQTNGAYDREKMKTHFLQKTGYNAAFGRTVREHNRESA